MKHTHISKTEFVTSFFDVSMSDFDLYILKKYLLIPLLVLCIPILGRPTLQCLIVFPLFATGVIDTGGAP
jgi:hypothetical protein